MSWLTKRLEDTEALVLTGVYDALSAKLLLQSGCEAVYCSGFSACASQFGLPDIGLVSFDEFLQYFTRIKRACGETPVVVDADTGHGGLLNVARTVALFAQAGINACHIEDQVFPKRCGHLAVKEVVGRNEAVARVRTAVDAAKDTGMAIIARTDAIAPMGFDEALIRANLFLEAGAVAAFIDAPKTIEQLEAIPQRVQGPLVCNAAPIAPYPMPADDELEKMGYQVILHPIELLMAASAAIKHAVNTSKSNQSKDPKIDFLSFSELNATLETERYLALEKTFSSPS
jgi:methylisocitrate lyase